MKIDDLMFRARLHDRQQALDSGEPAPQTPPLTFDTVQELLQKGDLSSAEMSLLDDLLRELKNPGLPDAGLSPKERDQIAALRTALQSWRENISEQATPNPHLRDHAPGSPQQGQRQGPVLPHHPALIDLPDEQLV